MNKIFLPHEKVTKSVMSTLIGGWIALFLLFWFISPTKLLPRPFDVLSALGTQWDHGLLIELLTSLEVNIEAIILATVVGLGLSYASVIPALKFPIEIIGKLRFLSLTGVIILFILLTPDGHVLKVSVLTFAITTFLVNDMVRVVENIPQSAYDYAETIGLTRAQVFWQVVIRGTLADAFDSIRMNAAMSWMMLTMVEGLSRSEGGVGVLLLDLNRSMALDAIFGIQLLLLCLGIGQDLLLKKLKAISCPYTVRD